MKKILSLILSLLLIFPLCVPAFAAAEVNQQCPTIYVPGFAGSKIYEDKNDPSTKLEFPEADVLLESVKKDILPSLLTYIATDNAKPFAYELCELVNNVFGGYFNSPDGTAKGNSGTYLSYPASVSKTSRLTFSYDWRQDPFTIAAELNNFIDYILEKSGAEKVAIHCHSLGSVICTTYLKVYGGDKVMGLILDSPALEGITYIGELLCGNPEFAGDSLARGIKDLMGENKYNELISGTIDMLELAGITDNVGKFLDELVEKAAPILYKETLVPLFGYWPATWAMSPDKYIDEAMEHVFTNYCAGEEYDALKAKIVKYNTDVRPYKKDTLLNFDVNGKLAVISRYGYGALPVSPSWDVLTDTVVDTHSASLGATTAPVDTAFSDRYLENKDMSLISPDRTVDASTCLFPEKTWFIKNLTHDKTGDTKPLHFELLFGEEEATVENFRLPRFLIYDAETDSIIEDTTVFEEPYRESFGESAFRKVINFFTALLNFLTDLFKNKK